MLTTMTLWRHELFGEKETEVAVSAEQRPQNIMKQQGAAAAVNGVLTSDGMWQDVMYALEDTQGAGAQRL